MANRSKSLNACSCASRPRFCRGMLLVIGFLFAFSRAGVADTRAGDPLVQPCLESLEGVNREIAQGASSRKVLLKLQQLKTTVKRAAPELNAGEKAKYQVLLEDTIEPAIVELAQNGDAPVTARARQNVRRAKSAVVQPAPVQPLISGKIDFETARGKKCSWDLGTLVQSLQRNPSKPSAAATRPATAADIATVRSFITSGKGTWLPNLRQWFRFKHRPMTPETISRRVAGFLEDYVSRPENLPRLGRDLGLKIPMKARIASVVIRTMRWCGLKVTIPGGDPETI
ncbi:MAG TPA: hypothetical protein PKO06_16530, partial [Candidatus Ozemobacteraceae bacterium]|nr:hypothetical protein [Candidatus Ozemobacteraceae bacterium]